MHRPLVALVASFAFIAACRESPSPAPAPTASARAAVTASRANPTASGAIPACASSGPRACAAPAPTPGPYTPPPEDSAAAPAPTPRKKIGTIDDWVRAYDGSGAPERKKPPQLGVLADVPALPKSTLLYVRSGQIVRVDLPAGTETQLTKGASSSRDPRWTRDGRAVFFLSNREGGVDKIFRMQPDGTGAQAITGGLRTGDLFTWAASDDGARVAYVANGAEGSTDLHVVDVVAHRDDILHNGVQISDPSFSRDGKQVFFVQGWFMIPGKDVENPKQLVALDLASRAAHVLPNAGVSEIERPFDLGDGRMLFIASTDFSMAGREPRMQTMPIAGGAWTRLGEMGIPAGYLHAVVSPGRKKIAAAWSARQGGFGADWYTEVSVMPFSGGPDKTLTGAFPRPFYGASSPSWAPDDRHIAFVLALCPYSGCEPGMRSVVIADTDQDNPKLVFVGYGGSPAFAPPGG